VAKFPRLGRNSYFSSIFELNYWIACFFFEASNNPERAVDVLLLRIVANTHNERTFLQHHLLLRQTRPLERFNITGLAARAHGVNMNISVQLAQPLLVTGVHVHISGMQLGSLLKRIIRTAPRQQRFSVTAANITGAHSIENFQERIVVLPMLLS